MLCKEVALFFGRKKVRCNVVEMDTTVETEAQLDSLLIPFNYDAGSKVAMRKPTEPGDFAGAVAFLVSPDAAHVNGADIRVDGGHLLYYGDR
jgi:NAD(P)-dependent dehydrogenase (short-subunit alcohol dehydrogenase family)